MPNKRFFDSIEATNCAKFSRKEIIFAFLLCLLVNIKTSGRAIWQGECEDSGL